MLRSKIKEVRSGKHKYENGKTRLLRGCVPEFLFFSFFDLLTRVKEEIT